MARISLKNIVGKKNDINAVVLGLIGQLNSEMWIEDEAGKVLLGNSKDTLNPSFPIKLDDEIIGWVKGDEKGFMIANLLAHLSQKETEKKKLGTEVLNLYQELNVIYNFSEKLVSEKSIYTIDSAQHEDFGCLSLVVKESGNCKGYLPFNTISKLVVSFFEEHFKNELSFSKTVEQEINKTIKKK